jgi:hypothetical protein
VAATRIVSFETHEPLLNAIHRAAVCR